MQPRIIECMDGPLEGFIHELGFDEMEPDRDLPDLFEVKDVNGVEHLYRIDPDSGEATYMHIVETTEEPAEEVIRRARMKTLLPLWVWIWLAITLIGEVAILIAAIVDGTGK